MDFMNVRAQCIVNKDMMEFIVHYYPDIGSQSQGFANMLIPWYPINHVLRTQHTVYFNQTTGRVNVFIYIFRVKKIWIHVIPYHSEIREATIIYHLTFGPVVSTIIWLQTVGLCVRAHMLFILMDRVECFDNTWNTAGLPLRNMV